MLKTRGDTSLLDAETKRNYNVAISYYKQKQAAFIKFMQQKIILKSEEEVQAEVEEIAQTINNNWSAIYERVINNIDIKNNVFTGYANQNKEYLYQLGGENDQLVLENYLLSLSNTKTKKEKGKIKEVGHAVYSELGFEYEKYVQNRLNAFAKKNFAQVTSNLKTVHGGIRTPGRMTISDIVITDQPIDNSIVANGIEMDYNITVEKKTLEGVLNTKISDNNLKDLLLQNNIFGMALKNWQSSNTNFNKEYTSSVAMASEINNMFIQTRPSSWNKHYAQAKTNNRISVRLINLIGPANVMLMAGTTMFWMSQFIENHFFYMNLYYKEAKDEEIYNIEASKKGSIYVADRGNVDYDSKDWLMAFQNTLLPRQIKIIEKSKNI